MTRAEILRDKISKKFEIRDIVLTKDPYANRSFVKSYDGKKTLYIEDVYKHNGSQENCSVRIYVYRDLPNGWQIEKIFESSKITEKSGERAIKNQINKALEKFLYNPATPFTMDMLDESYYQ